MRERIAACCITAALIVAAAANATTAAAARVVLDPIFPAPPPGTYTLPVIMPAPDGRVLDVKGRTVELRSLLLGHVTLLSFMFTRCRDPEGCPLAFETLQDLKQTLATDGHAHGFDRVRFISLSFDPEGDTPEAMRAYGAHAMGGPGPAWLFLTTRSNRDLGPLLDGFGQDLAESTTVEGRRTLSHVLKVYLIDVRARVREIYSTSWLRPDIIANDIRSLVGEGAARPPAQANAPRRSTSPHNGDRRAATSPGGGEPVVAK